MSVTPSVLTVALTATTLIPSCPWGALVRILSAGTFISAPAVGVSDEGASDEGASDEDPYCTFCSHHLLGPPVRVRQVSLLLGAALHVECCTCILAC